MSLTMKSNLDAVVKEVDNRSRDALREIGSILLVSAIQKCPVRTGNLQRSVETEYEDLTLRVGSQVHYAGYVEGGTPKMSARPYLRPALWDNLRKIRRIFGGIR